ncbi:biotin--[acetyl-CoA-carboxylase] ligase [Puteibacter caeruleilacunae]|nr:biotin--[acetyl-CoA-carboxylase] ligase [Puteibacter caeruleilacunae]
MKLIGKNTIKLDIVDSTNNYANRQLSEKQPVEGTVVLAGFQESGRGQINNYWESEANKNLTFSIVLYPSFLEIMSQFMISKVITLGLTDFLKQHVAEVAIKWPNDIYVGNKKIAGILVENAIRGGEIASSIVGVGLNINQEVFVSDAPNPISLKLLTGVDYELDSTLQSICDCTDYWYSKLKSGFNEELNQAFHERLYRLGEKAEFKDQQGTFTGVIKGVNAIGQLIIEDEENISKEYHFKEVEYVL